MNSKTTKKNPWVWAIALIIFALGVLLRIICLDKPEGFWIDEMNTYYISSKGFPFEIIKYLLNNDLHLPSYYLLLNLWMKLFGTGDIALRALSVVFGVLTLPVAYLVGKELNGYRFGIVTLLMFSINSGLIFYSKEVRFYSAIALFATLIALFLVRIKNNPTKANYIGLIISNILLIYTSTIGFVFVAMAMGIFFIYLKMEKQETKSFLSAGIITFILLLPLVPLLIFFAIKNFNSPFYYFDYYRLNLLFFYNILASISGPLAPINGIHYENLTNCLVLIPPLIIFILFILRGITKDKLVLTLFLIGFIPFLAETILSIMDKFALFYSHAIFCMPFFIIAASYGILSYKNKTTAFILFQFYLIINLSYTLYDPLSVNNIEKIDAFKTPSTYLKSTKATNKDLLFCFPFGGELISKYDYGARIVPIDLKDNNFFNKKVLRYLFDDDFVDSINKQNAYAKLKDYYYSTTPSVKLKKFVKEQTSTVQKGSYVYIATIDYVFAHKLKPTDMISAIWGKITMDTINIMDADKRFKLIKIKQDKKWHIYKYKRIY